MKEYYTCAICGFKYDDLDSYLACVHNCGEKLKEKQKAEEKQKRLEEVNAAINRVKEAKKYFEEQLAEFEKKYPEEYEMNFATEGSCNCKALKQQSVSAPEVLTLSYEDNGNGKPIIKANGRKVTDDFVKDLFEDPDMKYVGKLLGLLN